MIMKNFLFLYSAPESDAEIVTVSVSFREIQRISGNLAAANSPFKLVRHVLGDSGSSVIGEFSDDLVGDGKQPHRYFSVVEK